MGGITLDDFTNSVAYKEIFGRGLEEGQQQDRKVETAIVAIRVLQRRCGSLTSEQATCIQALSLDDLEALAEALFDLQGSADLTAWLAQRQG
jgi:hypothetical protein